MLSKITAASFMKLSYESDAWTMLSVILRARSPRIVPGAASYDFVEPIMIDQIDMVQEGDTVIIENGYTQAFRGDNSLNIGRYGKLRKA